MHLCLPSPRRVSVLVAALALTGLTAAAPAMAHHHHHKHHHHHSHTSSATDPDSGDSASNDGDDSTPTESSDDSSVSGTVATGTAQTITARITGYSFQDNTPPGSATISMPILHKVAGGTGTYADPITTAVPGHAPSVETPKGTRIYVAKLKRYFIVEDSGASKASTHHFDLWVGGQGFSKSASDKCMNSYTGNAQVIVNPPKGEPVHAGPLTGANGCVI